MKITQYIALLFFFATGMAIAEPATIRIPDQNWKISFDAPVLRKMKESNSPNQYMYFGNANLFNLSLYVETPTCAGGNTHEDFFKCYWPKTSKLAMIKQASVTTSCSEKYCKIAYDAEVTIQGNAIRQRSMNFLFAYRGKWVDVHVSVINPTEEDLALLKKFEASLSYSEDQ